jgi:hypothetical protein
MINAVASTKALSRRRSVKSKGSGEQQRRQQAPGCLKISCRSAQAGGGADECLNVEVGSAALDPTYNYFGQ